MSILIIICGPSGVGKTTIANLIANKINGKVLTSEKIIKEIFKKTSNEFKDQDFTKEEINKGYSKMFEKTKKLIINKSVILDGVFRSDNQRKEAIKLAKELSIPSKIILINCPEEIVKKRVTKRFESRIQPGGFNNHIFLKNIFEPITEKHFVVDSSKNVEKQLEKII